MRATVQAGGGRREAGGRLAVTFLAVAAVLLTGLPALAQPCEEEPCSIREIVERVTKNHPLVDAARQDTAVFAAKLKNVRLAYVPTFSSTGFFSVTPEKTGDPMSGATNYDNWGPIVRFGMDLSMPLLTFGKILNLKKMAREGVQVGKAQEQIAISQVEYLALQAYYALQFSSKIEDTLEEGGGYLRRARKYIENLRDSDDEDYDDVVMLRLRIYETDFETQKMNNARLKRLALSGLRELAGLSEEAFQPPAKLAAVPVKLEELDHYVALALRTRGELQALAAANRAMGYRVTVEKTNFLPDLYLAGYYSYTRAWAVEQQGSPFAYDPYNSWFAGGGLGMRWKIDLAKGLSAIDEARAEVRKFGAQARAMRQQVVLEVEEAYLEARDLKTGLKLARTAYKAARGWILAKLDLYETGVGEFTDLSDALSAFFRKRIAFDKAKLDYNLALARLAHACGIRFLDLTNNE